MNASAELASSLICQSRPVRRTLFDGLAAANPTEFRGGMHVPAIERTLAQDRLLALPNANVTLLCLDGELWLTRDGDIQDYILGPGQSFAARRGDRVTVQALRPSRFSLRPA